MRAVVQRVREARVTVGDEVTGEIGQGLLVLVGIAKGDGPEAVEYLAEKIVGLRIFADESSVMNRSLGEVGGGVLLVSQFTLYGDCRKGRRPSFDRAAPSVDAEPIYRRLADRLRDLGFPPREGVFGAHMAVSLTNDGPVTVLLDSERQL